MTTIQIDAERCRKLARLLKLPPNHKIYTGLAIGHPRFKYNNWIERKPARIQWFEKLKSTSEHEAQAVSATPA